MSVLTTKLLKLVSSKPTIQKCDRKFLRKFIAALHTNSNQQSPCCNSLFIKRHCTQAVPLENQDTVLRTYNKWLEVNNPSWRNSLKLTTRWLRDNCQCSECKDPKTGLRLTGLENPLDSPIQAHNAIVNNESLKIHWIDGHESTYDCNWLWQNCYEGQPNDFNHINKTLWNAAGAKKIQFSELDYEDFMRNENAIKMFLNSIAKYGIALVHKTPATPENTRLMMERIGPIWQTFWGEIYFVVADLEQHQHPSYTGNDLGFHTDTNYYFEGAGLQAFHVLEHNGTGGINKFVDGFYIANKIKQKYPAIYEQLSTVPVSFKYIEKHLHLVNEDILLKHDPATKELVQLRFSPYDLDVFRTIKPESVDLHYQSLAVLVNEMYNPDNIHWIHLKPGTVLVTDNWRILHGRSQFTGKRSLCGMYISRSDYLSRARQLGLL